MNFKPKYSIGDKLRHFATSRYKEVVGIYITTYPDGTKPNGEGVTCLYELEGDFERIYEHSVRSEDEENSTNK